MRSQLHTDMDRREFIRTGGRYGVLAGLAVLTWIAGRKAIRCGATPCKSCPEVADCRWRTVAESRPPRKG